MLENAIGDDRLVDDDGGEESEEVELGPLWRSYLLGQCGHLLRVSLWWSGLSPLAFALVGKDSAVGAVRVAFNIALLIFSPMAGVIAERVPMEKILIYTTATRAALYSVCLPLIWVILRSDLVGVDSVAAAFAAFVVVCFLDGVQVSIANVVDVDMGGVDILGSQRGLLVTDALRNKMNAIYQIVFDGSFLVFTPCCALLGWYVGETAVKEGDDDDTVDSVKSGILVAIFAAVFFFTSIFSLYHYKIGVGSAHTGNEAEYQPLDATAGDTAIRNENEDQPEHEPILASIWAGAKLCWETEPIRWRLLFLGLEIALEDAMVAVVVAEYAYTSRYFGNGDSTQTNLYTALIIAVGKVGAIAAGSFMHSCWRVPKTKRDYRPLFFSVLLSSLSVCILLLAFKMEQSRPDHPKSATAWISKCLVFLSVILFFLFSTAPKIGFETLLQGMASSVEGSGKIFGFVGPFISIMDSIVVMSISLAFSVLKEQCEDSHDSTCIGNKFEYALLITCGIFLTHGLVESMLGPMLMLPKSLEMLQSIGIQE